jgi:hypothetical protein
MNACSAVVGQRVNWLGEGSRPPNKFNSVHLLVTAATHLPQNVDMPLVLPNKGKKKKTKSTLKQVTRKKYTKRLLEPVQREPENGLLVERLIPVAHEVLEAKAVLIKGVELLLKANPAWACRWEFYYQYLLQFTMLLVPS